MKLVTKRTRLKHWLSSTVVHDNLHIICIFRYLHLSKEQAPSLSDIIDTEKPKPVSGFSLAKPPSQNGFAKQYVFCMKQNTFFTLCAPLEMPMKSQSEPLMRNLKLSLVSFFFFYVVNFTIWR